MATAFDDVFLLIIVIVVIRECGETDEALDEIGVQFNEEAEVGQTGNYAGRTPLLTCPS